MHKLTYKIYLPLSNDWNEQRHKIKKILLRAKLSERSELFAQQYFHTKRSVAEFLLRKAINFGE